MYRWAALQMVRAVRQHSQRQNLWPQVLDSEAQMSRCKCPKPDCWDEVRSLARVLARLQREVREVKQTVLRLEKENVYVQNNPTKPR